MLTRAMLRLMMLLIACRYGLYFGILGRDVAEVASDQMVCPCEGTETAVISDLGSVAPLRIGSECELSWHDSANLLKNCPRS